MSRKRNKGNKNRSGNNQLKKYNNFREIPNTNRMQINNKLYLHENLENILNNIIKISRDPIASKLLTDSKKSAIPTRVSWLNITKSNDHLSYALPDKVKKPGDEWLKQNRQPIQFRKLIKKIYGRQFSNSQIKTFISKFKNHYSQFSKKPMKKESGDEKIVDNLMKETVDGEMKWKFKSATNYYEKYTTEIFITDKKYVLVEFYNIIEDKESFISLRLMDNGKNIFMRSITDAKNIEELKIFIEE